MNYYELFLLWSKFRTFFIFSEESAFFLFWKEWRLFCILRTMRVFFLYSDIERYRFYIIKILHIWYIRFVCQIFNLILTFRYVNYTTFYSIIIIVFFVVYFNQDHYVKWKLVFSTITQHNDFENKVNKKSSSCCHHCYDCCWPTRFYQWRDCNKFFDYRW